MPVSSDPVRLFSERTSSYVRFIRFVRYPQGLRAYFLHSQLLRAGLRVLDAGCGTGVLTLALREACLARGLNPGISHAFDLTPSMLDRFRSTLRKRAIQGIEILRADVLALDGLPDHWCDYDLVVSSAMLEYVPRENLGVALRGLRSRLREGGSIVLFMTRRNWLTRPLIGLWWQSNLYDKHELEYAFCEAGFESVTFGHFPGIYRYLGVWGYIVQARAALK